MSTIIESGIQLLARISENSKKSLEGLDDWLFPEGFHKSEAVEISGDSGSGKTLLLTQLIASCILPTEYKGFNINVILMNSDHHLQVSKLAELMRNIIKKSSKNSVNLDESELEEVVELSLKNLLIINCTNNYQFVCSLYSLSNILKSNTKIGIVAIDGISSFYWQDRETREKAPVSMNAYALEILNEIQQSTFQFNVKIIFTKHAEFETKSKGLSQCTAQPSLRKVNHRIHLSKEMNSTQGTCKVESIKGFRSFDYKTTEAGLEWLEANET